MSVLIDLPFGLVRILAGFGDAALAGNAIGLRMQPSKRGRVSCCSAPRSPCPFPEPSATLPEISSEANIDWHPRIRNVPSCILFEGIVCGRTECIANAVPINHGRNFLGVAAVQKGIEGSF
jgi:hypothetical protein